MGTVFAASMPAYVPGGPSIGRPRSRAHEEALASMGLEWIRRKLPHLRDDQGRAISRDSMSGNQRFPPGMLEAPQTNMPPSPHRKSKRSRHGAKTVPPTDWKEVFARVDEGKDPRRQLMPVYHTLEQGPGATTPMLDKIRWKGNTVKAPFAHIYQARPTLERVIGLPKERKMQAWKTTHKVLHPGCEINEDYSREQQRENARFDGFFASFVHEARMKGVDLTAKGHIYKDMNVFDGDL